MSASNDHPLQNRYCFWFMDRSLRSSVESYEDAIKRIGSFKSVDGFWRIYSHIKRPGSSAEAKQYDFHMFKDGIKPMWEDPANVNGGRWLVFVPKELVEETWERLLLAIVGEQFDVGQEICGAVCAAKGSEFVISVWNRTASNFEATNRIKDAMRRFLRIHPSVPLEYKRHAAAGRHAPQEGGGHHFHHFRGQGGRWGGGGGDAWKGQRRQTRRATKARSAQASSSAAPSAQRSTGEQAPPKPSWTRGVPQPPLRRQLSD